MKPILETVRKLSGTVPILPVGASLATKHVAKWGLSPSLRQFPDNFSPALVSLVLGAAVLVGAARAQQPIATRDAEQHLGPAVLVGAARAQQPIATLDAEHHLGLVADQPALKAARANTVRLNAAMDAMHPAGQFTFADGTSGPILDPVHFAAKRFYFAATETGERLRTGSKGGGTLIGTGGGSPLGQGSFGPRSQGGQQTHFVYVDAEAGSEKQGVGSIGFRLRNNGFHLENIYLYGRRLLGNINSGDGPMLDTGIALEARNSNSSGKHRIINCATVDFDCGVHFLAGYYDPDGSLVPNNHADNTTWNDLRVRGGQVGIRSDNNGSVWHRFTGVTQFGVSETCLDVRKGGLWKFDNLIAGGMNVTLLQVGEPDQATGRDTRFSYGRNNARFDIHFLRDGYASTTPPTPGRQRLTLFRYAGQDPQSWRHWDVRMTGNVAGNREEFADDPTQWVDLNGLNGVRLLMDARGLPDHIAAPFWPHGAYRLSEAERDKIHASHLAGVRDGLVIYNTTGRRHEAWNDATNQWETVHTLQPAKKPE